MVAEDLNTFLWFLVAYAIMMLYFKYTAWVHLKKIGDEDE